MSDQPTALVDYPEDCERLVHALLSIGVMASLKEAEEFWSWRSDQWCAGWLSFRVEEAVDEVRKWWPQYQAARKP